MPTILSWREDDWLYLWEQVIINYVQDCIFVNDWQYSNGCTYEFYIAIKNNKRCYDETLSKTISALDGYCMILNATKEVYTYGECLNLFKHLHLVYDQLTKEDKFFVHSIIHSDGMYISQ
jgi:hypothetical protein